MAGIPIVVQALVAVAGTKKNYAAFAGAPFGRCVLDGQARAGGQWKHLGVPRVGWVGPVPFERSPATGNDVRAMLRRPIERVCLGPRAQWFGQLQRHETGPRCHAAGTGTGIAIGAGHACRCRAVAFKGIFRARALRGITAIEVLRTDDLRGAGELGMVDVEGIVDDRDHHTVTLGQGVSSLDVGAGIDLELVADGGFLQVPLVVMDRPPLSLAQHFRVAIFHVMAFEQLPAERADVRAATVLMVNEEGVFCVGHLLFDLKVQRIEDVQALHRRELIDELQEQVLGVENRVSSVWVHQDAAGETYVRQGPQHGFAVCGVGMLR
ncbi:hypothetical protein D3C73_1043800 [compost metagenome]